MPILTRAAYCAKVFQNEGQFTASTYMYISQNYQFLNGLFFHIPNESPTSDLMRIQQAAKGVLPGVPDFRFEPLIVAYRKLEDNITKYTPNPPITPGWYLELKMPNGKLSEAQSKLYYRWLMCLIDIQVVYNQLQVCAQLEKRYGLPKYL